MKIKHWYYCYPILTLTKLTVNTFLKTKQKKKDICSSSSLTNWNYKYLKWPSML